MVTTAADACSTTTPSRQPKNWAVLHALASLTPPSPSLSAAEGLATLCSVGEIPIILDAGIYVPDSPDTSVQPLSGSMAPSGSVGTVGTFGPVHGKRRGSWSFVPGNSHESVESALQALRCTTPTNQTFQLLSPISQYDGGYYDHRASVGSQFTISAYLNPPPYEQIETLSPSGSVWSSPGCSPYNSPVITRFNGKHWTTSPDNTTNRENASSQPRFPPRSNVSSRKVIPSASMSPSQSIITIDEGSSFAPALRDISAGGPSRSSSSISLQTQRMSPIRVTLPDNRASRLPCTGSAGTSNSARSIRSDHSARSIRSNPSPISMSSPSLSVPSLPDVLSWLRETVIEIWIDQESFRLARPTFKLVGYTSTQTKGLDADLASALTLGTAELRPTKRETFVFHHGTLDPPPVLGRLTMAGDDSRDFLSRQASLAIKANGVYSVNGTESFDHTPPSPRAPSQPKSLPLKLQWRFEYLVDDRRAEASGKVMQGEKTITPLSFSCSPGLLHPSRGKKVKLMHIFMKSLTPKLTSEKMEVPKPLSPRTPEHPSWKAKGKEIADDAAGVREEPVAVHGPKSRLRRSSSATFVSGSNIRPDRSPSGGRTSSSRQRPRKAASIAMLPQVLETQTSYPADHSLKIDPRGELPGPERHVARHIVSPSELAELLYSPPQTVGLKPPSHYNQSRASSRSQKVGDETRRSLRG